MFYNIHNDDYYKDARGCLTKSATRDLHKWYKIHYMNQIGSANAAVRWLDNGARAELYSYTTRVMVVDRVYFDGRDAFVCYYNGINTYSRSTTRHVGRFIGLLCNGTPGYVSPMQLCDLACGELVKLCGTDFIKGGMLLDSIIASTTTTVKRGVR